jgi:hypothetical protein
MQWRINGLYRSIYTSRILAEQNDRDEIQNNKIKASILKQNKLSKRIEILERNNHKQSSVITALKDRLGDEDK